jgi:crotonobetainyl-CoA:carnitine CoA-transferase CaiB-like acyl-CoA transferase
VGSSLLANGVWANGYFAQAALCGATIIDRPPRERGFNALSSYYRCRDGRWLILTILNEDRQWPALARALARADLLDDARFATKPQRLANSQALIRILDEAFATYDLDYWRDVLAANGLVFDMVTKVSEISSDDQMLANQVLVPFEDEAVLTVNSPLFVQGASKVPPRRPPDIGQHSEEILREAGYDDAALMELRASGVII